MKKIIYNRVITKDFDIELKVDGNGKPLTRNKLSNAEWKAAIFGKYDKNGKFNYRNQITIISNNFDKDIKKDDKVEIRDGKLRILGYGKVDKIEDNKFTLIDLNIYDGKSDNDNFDTKIEKLFRFLDKNQINEREKYINSNNKLDKVFNDYKKSKDSDKEKFINTTFKIFYDSLIEYLKNYFCYKKEIYVVEDNKVKCKNKIIEPEGKFSAYCSYIALRKYIEDNYKEDFKISPMNVYVKGYKLEYDALLLKNSCEDDNSYVYDIDNVLATIEIKSSGYFGSGDASNNFEVYMRNQKIDKIPHIYLAFHESSNKKEDNNSRYYDQTYKTIKKLNNEKEQFIPIFCKIRIDSEYIYIPFEYDIDQMLCNFKKRR